MKLVRDDFNFHGVSEEENKRLGDSAYKRYIEKSGDIHEQGGDLDMENIEDMENIKTVVDLDAYITLLEEKIKELYKEVQRYEEKERLTELWARGEIEN